MEKSDKNRKITLLQNNETRGAKLACLNYCVSGLMSRCSAGTVWQEQKKCKFANKSTVSSRCMYYIEAIDGHCDCVEAQWEMKMEMKKTRNRLNRVPNCTKIPPEGASNLPGGF